MEGKTKEQIYDEQISPLMAQIIEICKTNKMALIASISLGVDDEGDFMCTTALLGDEYEPPAKFMEARMVLYSKPSPMMITTKDAIGNVKNCTVVLG